LRTSAAFSLTLAGPDGVAALIRLRTNANPLVRSAALQALRANPMAAAEGISRMQRRQ